MSLRQLNFEDVKKLLIDPWHVLVVDSLSNETVICTYGEKIYDVVEEVTIDNELSNQLNILVEENVIFYDSLDDEELKNRLPNPHFFELWREDAYGPQPDIAYEKAAAMGLSGSLRD
jgi:hypothetical protein